jgi:hypothetical protein
MNQQTTIQSLLERFKNAEKKTSHSGNEFYPDHNKMEWELQRLLNSEFNYGMRYSAQTDIDTLREFKEHFDWDTKYGVTIKWEVDPSTASQLIDCGSSEEISAYLSGAKQPECPAYEDVYDYIDYGCELTGHFSTDARIGVENLRPKQAKIPNKYMVNILFECEIDAKSMEVHLNEILKESSVIKHAQVCAVTADA